MRYRRTLIGCSLLLLAACSGEIGSSSEDDWEPIELEPKALALDLRTVIQHAKNAGLPCDRLVVAGALAMAESGGYTNATNWNPPSSDCPSGSTDRGLWQINDCYWDNYADSCTFDAACNAKAMAEISGNGASFQLWSAFVNGSYQQYLDDAQAAYDQGIQGCGGSAPPKPAQNTCSALGYDGSCVGDTSIWWENGDCRVRDCAAEGKSCGLISAAAGYGCLGGTAGAQTRSCEELGYTGQCGADDTLVWFEDGECRWAHCPDTLRQCGSDGQNGMNCLP